MRKVWDAKTKKIIKVEDELQEAAKKSETDETEESEETEEAAKKSETDETEEKTKKGSRKK